MNNNKIILRIGVVCFFIALILVVILMASVPPVDRDSLTHHLVVPKLYLKNGGIYEIPDIEFSYYPQLIDLLYIIPLYFKNDIIPKYIHFAFAILASVFVFKMLMLKRCSTFCAVSGAAFFLSLPLIIKLSVSAYVDLGLYFFSFASLYYLLLWNRNESIKNIIYSGVLCGLAMSSKYNGLITFFCMFFSVSWLASKKEQSLKNPVLTVLLFSSISIAVFSPWLIKNYVWTGNPLYPLYKNIFLHPEQAGNNEIDSGDSKEEKLSHFYYRKVLYKESPIETLSTPARIFFSGKDDDPRFFDGVLNPLLFFMPLTALLIEFIRKKNNGVDNEIILLFVFSWVYIFFVFFQTDMRIRWTGVAIAPLTVLSFLAANDIFSTIDGIKANVLKNVFKLLIIFFVIMFFWFNFRYIIDLFNRIAPLTYLNGEITRDGYIQKHRSEYASYQYINSNLPLNSKILGLYVGNRIYYCDRPIISNEQLFMSYINNSEYPEKIRSEIQNKGITHIVLGEDLYNAYFISQLDNSKRDILKKFWIQYTRKIFYNSGYSVYEITG